MSIFSSHDLMRAKRRATKQLWAAEIFAALRARADHWIRHPANVPTLAGGWIHDYVCAEHWNALTFDPQLPSAHRCRFGETRTGEKLDAAWRVTEHRRLAATARDLGLVFALTAERVYADYAGEILMQYANNYARYAGASAARGWMLKGRVFNQALSEAIWAVPLIHAYDLIRADLAPQQAAHIVDGLLRPLIDTLTIAQDELVDRQKNLKSNYNAWFIAAIGLLGYALNDDALVARAIDSNAGFRAHLATAILLDGFEYEGTPYYHNFCALAYSILAQAARANGRDLYAERAPHGQSIEAMWRAFASLAYADGSMPALNDGAYQWSGPFALEICETYEIALARTREPAFAWLVNRHSAGKRDTWTALLFAEQDIANAPAPRRASICLPAVGIAVLRNDVNALQVCVPFGAFAGSHSHLDRLAPQIFPFATDPGTPLYGVPARIDWFQQTAAHNAIVVDGKAQAPCAGKLMNWGASSNAATLQLTADDAYAGVRFARAITLVNGVLADSVSLASDDAHTYDWILHSDGGCELDGLTLTPANGKLADDGAYQFIEIVARGTGETNSCTVTVKHSGKKFRLTLTGNPPFEIIIARSPAHVAAPTQPRQMLIGRTRARVAGFVALYELVK